MKRYRTVLEAIYRLYAHSGFTMAGAVAFSFVVSLFPFCIFLGALSGIFGGRKLATEAVTQLFQVLPQRVAEGIAPQVDSIMSSTRIDLLTVSAGLSLFFATNAIETLRAALNGAYRVTETRPYLVSLFRSTLFVFISAVSMLVLTYAVLVGPVIAHRYEPHFAQSILRSTWFAATVRYAARRRRHGLPAHGVPPVAGGRRAHAQGRVAGRAALDLPLARAREPLLLLPQLQRLHALLCRPVAAHGGADLLPDECRHHDPRGRAQPRHLRIEAARTQRHRARR